jgi:hypothetical protein
MRAADVPFNPEIEKEDKPHIAQISQMSKAEVFGVYR